MSIVGQETYWTRTSEEHYAHKTPAAHVRSYPAAKHAIAERPLINR